MNALAQEETCLFECQKLFLTNSIRPNLTLVGGVFLFGFYHVFSLVCGDEHRKHSTRVLHEFRFH